MGAKIRNVRVFLGVHTHMLIEKKYARKIIKYISCLGSECSSGMLYEILGGAEG